MVNPCTGVYFYILDVHTRTTDKLTLPWSLYTTLYSYELYNDSFGAAEKKLRKI